jgi:hypothetical protein
MTSRITGALLSAALVLGACGEKAQTASPRKSDGKPWDASQNAFVAEGWKAGDQASWEQQMRQRAQNQNEYSRAPAKSP